MQYELKVLGEIEGLNTIRRSKTLRAPKPITSGRTVNGCHFIVLECLKMTVPDDKIWTKLGRQLANMHLHNLQNKSSLVPMWIFGFFLQMV